MPTSAWSPPRGRVLVLAPHPDDETIGCGGVLLRHRRQGDAVKVVFVTDGLAGDPRRLYRGRDYRAIRRAEARRAARILGVTELEFWDCPDGALAGVAALRGRLRELLGAERPDIVYRPSAADPHPDHGALARHFEAAARGRRGFLDCRYEVCFLQRPSAVADISDTFARKAEALRQYRSQLRYGDYPALMTRTAVCRSLFLPRAGYGEAFRVSRPASRASQRRHSTRVTQPS